MTVLFASSQSDLHQDFILQELKRRQKRFLILFKVDYYFVALIDYPGGLIVDIIPSSPSIHGFHRSAIPLCAIVIFNLLLMSNHIIRRTKSFVPLMSLPAPVRYPRRRLSSTDRRVGVAVDERSSSSRKFILRRILQPGSRGPKPRGMMEILLTGSALPSDRVSRHVRFHGRRRCLGLRIAFSLDTGDRFLNRFLEVLPTDRFPSSANRHRATVGDIRQIPDRGDWAIFASTSRRG